MPTKLVHYRTVAFVRQSGRCFYCGFPMWMADPAEFCAHHRLTLAQAHRMRCTAEHLLPREKGGRDSAENIVAACLHCRRLANWRPDVPRKVVDCIWFVAIRPYPAGV
jgi:hypothetical protein